MRRRPRRRRRRDRTDVARRRRASGDRGHAVQLERRVGGPRGVRVRDRYETETLRAPQRRPGPRAGRQQHRAAVRQRPAVQRHVAREAASKFSLRRSFRPIFPDAGSSRGYRTLVVSLTIRAAARPRALDGPAGGVAATSPADDPRRERGVRGVAATRPRTTRVTNAGTRTLRNTTARRTGPSRRRRRCCTTSRCCSASSSPPPARA